MERIYDEKYKSECHNSKVFVVGTNEGTNHYECDFCLKPCNVIPVVEEVKENVVTEPIIEPTEPLQQSNNVENDVANHVEKERKTNPIPNSVPFTKENQPTPEARKRAWDRRRVAQAFMDLVIEYQDMPAEDFEALTKDMQTNKKKYTVFEMMAHKYATKVFNKDKFLLDFMSRHVSKAPRDINLETKQPITKVVVEVVKGNNESINRGENSEVSGN